MMPTAEQVLEKYLAGIFQIDMTICYLLKARVRFVIRDYSNLSLENLEHIRERKADALLRGDMDAAAQYREEEKDFTRRSHERIIHKFTETNYQMNPGGTIRVNLLHDDRGSKFKELIKEYNRKSVIV